MGFNVLVVDDSATTRNVITKTFRLANIPINEVHEAGDGRQALDILDHHWIDVVFTDINMPVMDGIQLVDRMAQDGVLNTIPVVLVTIEGSTKRVEELKAKGIAGFIRKPFTPEKIREVFDEVMLPRTQASDRSKIGEVFERVLEEYAFMFCGVAEKKDLPPCRGGALRAVIYFTGRLSGHLALAVPQALCPAIAANVLGLEPDDRLAAERAEDSLKELANVTCGQVLTAVAGTDAVFEMAVPEVGPLDEARWETLVAEQETLVYLVDESPVLLQLKLEGMSR